MAGTQHSGVIRLVSPRHSVHGQWSSRYIFVLALTGSAVGLGNIWKFPYLAGENGGGAFVVVYLLCTLVIGIPLMAAEVLVGRRTRRSPILAMHRLAIEEGRTGLWSLVGWLGVLAAVILLSTYSVVGGWSMAYVFRAATGELSGLDAYAAGRLFRQLIGDPERLLAWHTLFLAITTLVVGRGVRHGLEEAVRYFMPLLAALLLVLVVYAVQNGDPEAAADFLFSVDFSRLSAEGVLAAMGHAFFTLSLGMGVIMAYSAYAGDRIPILQSVLIVVVLDVGIAVLAGLATFPLVFGNALEPGSGPGLVFQTLPLAFSSVARGEVYATLFFVLLLFAAWTSAISLLEPAVAFLIERWRIDRPLATNYLAIGTWVLGLASVFSFNIWSHVHPLDGIEGFEQRTLFDVLNFAATNIMLPLVGLGLAVFAGWRLRPGTARLELGSGPGYRVWLQLIRYVTPLAVLLVLLNSTGLLDWMGDK